MRARFAVAVLLAAAVPLIALAGEKTERFDADPGWEEINNRSALKNEPREVRQDFGWSATSHAGGAAGEIGGYITPSAEAAFYAKEIAPRGLDAPMRASGTLLSAPGASHLLLGFFNADSVNEWRTPSSIAIRISGRGEVFYAWLEYCTARWRAGGDSPQGFQTPPDPQTGRPNQLEFKSGVPLTWTLEYDPKANGGAGSITATIGGVKAVCDVAPEHRAEGASVNRFGLLNIIKSVDGGGEIWLDDVAIDGEKHGFAADPGWDARRNRETYKSNNVRPWFNFGWSPTAHAGGARAGEIGGVLFRGDCRYATHMASYGDRAGPLSLERPIHASGRVALVRGVTDSGVLFGFFNSRTSMEANPQQATGLPQDFFGISTDGPSSEGFLFAPVYRVSGDIRGGVEAARAPHLYPTGESIPWSFDYDPAGAGGRGRISVKVGERAIECDLAEGAKASGTTFDRFGFVTPWVDGNSQTIYFDDLTYTVAQP